MKKFIFSLLFVLALVVAVSPAFALQCKEGNYGSDECWTNVVVSSGNTTPVIAGTVLVYDFSSDHSADDAAWTVRASSAITDGYKVAGVAQGPIATGDRGMILVRGQGQLRTTAAITSGDRLFPSTTAGQATKTNAVDVASAASRDGAIAFALETSAAASTMDAYIVVV